MLIKPDSDLQRLRARDTEDLGALEVFHFIQIQVTSTLTMFDIQDKFLYTLEFKLKCITLFLYTYYIKYIFSASHN